MSLRQARDPDGGTVATPSETGPNAGSAGPYKTAICRGKRLALDLRTVPMAILYAWQFFETGIFDSCVKINAGIFSPRILDFGCDL
jgi:hypothetical protein